MQGPENGPGPTEDATRRGAPDANRRGPGLGSLRRVTDVHDEPSKALADPQAILLGQLAYYRSSLLTKLEGLSSEQLTGSVLPSSWAPLELLRHLVYVERRWMEWGFAGVPVADPWADHDPATDGWTLAPGDTLPGLASRLAEVAARTEALAGEAALSDRARAGGRFAPDQARGGEEPPTLGWILAHLLQEYARHVGHLDVVRELIDGSTGE